MMALHWVWLKRSKPDIQPFLAWQQQQLPDKSVAWVHDKLNGLAEEDEEEAEGKTDNDFLGDWRLERRTNIAEENLGLGIIFDWAKQPIDQAGHRTKLWHVLEWSRIKQETEQEQQQEAN